MGRVPRRRHLLKLIAVDLDGTLLDVRGVPHAVDVEALKRAQSQGVHVTIITGRMFSGSRHVAAALGLTGAIACVDGAQIVESGTERSLHHRSIEAGHAELLRASAQRHGAHTYLLSGDRIVHRPADHRYLQYMETWTKDQSSTDELFSHEAWGALTALVTIGEAAQIDAIARSIPEDAAAKLVFPAPGHSDHVALFLRAAKTDKGTALQWLANHFGCELHQTVAVGDWLNDLPMLRVAGRAFAMGQAPAEVRAVASDLLSQTNVTGGGIARAVELALAE